MLLVQQPVGASLANQDISLTSFDPNYAAIQRQQRLAELLSQQANAPIEINSGGGAQAPINPLAALAKGFQGYAGSYLDKKAQDKAAALQGDYRKQLADQLSHFYQQPGAAMPGIAPQQTAINATAPAIPGAPAPDQRSVSATMPGQTGGPVPTSTQDQMTQSLQMMGSGNPYMQNIAPQLYAAALNRGNMDYQHGVQRQDKMDDLKLPMSTAAQQQIDAQSAATQRNAQFTNQLPETQYQRDSLAVERNKAAEEKRAHDLMYGNNLGADDPAGNAWVKAVTDGSVAGINNVPKRYQSFVAEKLANAPQQVFTPMAGRRFAMTSNQIVGPLMKLPQYELTAQGLPLIQRMQAALKTPGSVSDQELLDSFTKLSTSGNAVTDAQVRIITDGKTVKDWANIQLNKLGANGGVLSPQQRKDIMTIAAKTYDKYREGYEPLYKEASEKLTAGGVPKPFWTIPDLNKLNAAQTSGAAAGAPAPSFNSLTNPKNDPLGLR